MAYSLSADEYRTLRAARALLRGRSASKAARKDARATVKRLTRAHPVRRARRNPEGGHSSHTMLWIIGGVAVALFLFRGPRGVAATQPTPLPGTAIIQTPGGHVAVPVTPAPTAGMTPIQGMATYHPVGTATWNGATEVYYSTPTTDPEHEPTLTPEQMAAINALNGP